MARAGNCVAALAAVILLAAAPATASAHQMPTSAVLLTIGPDTVGGEIQLPIDRLAVALKRDLTPAEAAGPLRAEIQRYTRRHIHAVGAGGAEWKVTVGGGHIERIDNIDNVVMSLSLTPPRGKVTDFDLRYDVIIEQLVTHKAIATIRSQWDKGITAHDPETLGLYDWHTKSLRADADNGSWLRGFLATAGLGVQDISERADHLLFLLMLLIPAPLVMHRGRWRGGDDARASAFRVVRVVTAFAVGHSMTLALATFGLIHLPSQLVESLISLSILVAAVHALRPLVLGGEGMIAAGFGLVHGLAFATLLSELGFSSDARASSLLGFTLGIEATQLVVVALMMPSLYALSRSAAYGVVRSSAALLGIVLAGAWFLERTTLIDSDPFASVSTALIAHPFAVAAAFALLATVARYFPGLRGPSSLSH
jgi:HupE / UreJ protein